ncbi:hypothetical protein [Halobacteriovorax marinus]|uniref:hypothetical protein n=1 Tax=Halobacteriovorax marinus TaxID=97084 RepID=UPI003A91F91F
MSKFFFISIFLCLVSCSFSSKREVYKKKLDAHQLTKVSAWQWTQNYNLETKVTTKLSDHEEELLEILKGAHSLYPAKGFTPSGIDDNSFQHIFRYTILTLPRELKIFLNNHIKKIFLVKGLGVSTLTIQLESDEKENSGKFISFLDIDVLNQKINDWYKWRESTAFKKDEEYSYKPYLSHENTVVNTSQMALAYLSAIILNWNPEYFPTSREAYFLNPNKYKFLNTSWKIKNGLVSPIYHDLLEDLHYLRYYSKGEPLFSTKEQSIFYKEIEKTGFVNLFSLMGSSKDFIESIANYIYVEKFKHPYSIDFYEKEKLIGTFESCWQQVRCQHKRDIIEEILNKEIYLITR